MGTATTVVVLAATLEFQGPAAGVVEFCGSTPGVAAEVSGVDEVSWAVTGHCRH